VRIILKCILIRYLLVNIGTFIKRYVFINLNSASSMQNYR